MSILTWTMNKLQKRYPDEFKRFLYSWIESDQEAQGGGVYVYQEHRVNPSYYLEAGKTWVEFKEAGLKMSFRKDNTLFVWETGHGGRKYLLSHEELKEKIISSFHWESEEVGDNAIGDMRIGNAKVMGGITYSCFDVTRAKITKTLLSSIKMDDSNRNDLT